MKIELNYEQQQKVLANNIWFDVLITFWNENNDTIKEVSFLTQYPNEKDIFDSMCVNGTIDHCKDFGGDFDNFELTKIKADYKALFYLNIAEILVD